ncbi:magnesium chelatase subunit D family protein [Methanobacterium alkalithermotolerans]|uniref:Magnesium chelatase subunit D family protein n=1 Tax=Methanobacterium alkalithermotolerans TaxID=2731220 RepID=A0A8T8KAM2_9EURY|nr:magnesium chelatase subunit D family protein [Methanobacterium alkalithermotolerans]QUH22461.1 magnesium chelatase subunit D family protein [Methanobacterium alkalithermotolerans]
MHHKFVIFPFTALVGQDSFKKALLINAVDPGIGGVLIKGDKGTGKSTAVRSLSHLLPSLEVVSECPFNCHPRELKLMCPDCQEKHKKNGKLPSQKKPMEIIDLPISATEDMVIGSINIKKVLEEGNKALEPGILARANRNILYIDEVNLLDEHLVNVLLDSAAMGVNIVEREGISIYHPSRFILVGTMNPEEGELRPQIMDRFGLSVDIQALNTKKERLKIMEYRREFDTDPWLFENRFLKKQKKLEEQIIQAKEQLPLVKISEDMLEMIVDITTGLGIKTHRADIVMEKTSRALAALDGRKDVTAEDVKEAAIMALKHRMKQLPFEKEEELNLKTLEQIIQQQNHQKEEIFDFEKKKRIKKDINQKKAFSAIQGKSNSPVVGDRGKYIKARENSKPTSVAIDATIKKAIRENGKLEVLPEHLMEKVRVSRGDALYLILLDSSSSMGLEKKIRLAKSLSWLLLKESYEKKNKIALMAFRGDEAQLLSAPTRDVQRIEEALEKLPTGGKTPLTPAIYQALEILQDEKNVTPTLVVISDGRCNVFMESNLEEDLRKLSQFNKNINMVFVNAETKNRSMGILEEVADCFLSPCFYLEEII